MPFDVFRLRDHVVQEYRDYVESFVHVLDTRIDDFVRERLAEGEPWPDAVSATWWSSPRYSSMFAMKVSGSAFGSRYLVSRQRSTSCTGNITAISRSVRPES
jgi:hypothetical protein